MKEITNYDKDKDILSSCVIDESNHYYQQIRTYLKHRDPYSRMTISDTERIKKK